MQQVGSEREEKNFFLNLLKIAELSAVDSWDNLMGKGKSSVSEETAFGFAWMFMV